MFNVYDREHQLIASFSSLKAAEEYKIAMGRPDWYIPTRKSTPRQRAAVQWCESVFSAIGDPQPFKGNPQYFSDCSNYLGRYLNIAKAICEEAVSGFDFEKYGY